MWSPPCRSGVVSGEMQALLSDVTDWSGLIARDQPLRVASANKLSPVCRGGDDWMSDAKLKSYASGLVVRSVRIEKF